jgi:bifunctional non-homologous end joining protein LigD
MPLLPVEPMLATQAAALPRGDDWTYEVKFDGYRTIAIKSGKRVTLYSRNLKDVTRMYPSIVAAVATVKHDVVLDGEVIALDAEGRPSFQALHHQSSPAASTIYYAFDLLHIGTTGLARTPLAQRREELERALAGSRVLRSEALPGTPEQIERAVRSLKMEGVVAKRQQSIYEPGKRSKSWIKVKFNQRQEFVIGGFRPSSTSFDSLVVGYYEGTRLHFAGRVRAGFTPHARAEVFESLAPLQADRCPFVDLPSSRSGHWGEGVSAEDMAKIRWVKPRVVVEVSFVEWTRDGALRHSQFVALRTDKRARDVRRESASG